MISSGAATTRGRLLEVDTSEEFCRWSPVCTGRKKHIERADGQGVDDKHTGEIVGEIVIVEVKKSSRKREKDVCTKHIYLIE